MTVPLTFFAMSHSAMRHRVGILATIDELEENVPFTVVCLFDDDGWGRADLKNLRGTALFLGDTRSWVTGAGGEIVTSYQGNITSDRLPDSGYDGRHLGQPNQIRMIGERLYVCGFAGQVYTQEKSGKWVHMDDGLVEKEGTAKSIDLEDIGGTGPNDIYVVGSSGLIAHWNGKKWTRVPAVTNVYLAAVRCPAPSYIVAVGDNGVIVEGDGKKWRASVIPGCDELSLADVEVYQDRLYVAAVEKLMVRTGNKWEEVKHGLSKKKTSFYKLTVGDGKLWAMGTKRLNSFDGKKWTAHPNPDNG